MAPVVPVAVSWAAIVPAPAEHTAQEASEEIDEARWTPHLACTILRELGTRRSAPFGRDDRGDGHRDPVSRWPGLAAATGEDLVAVVERPAGVPVAREDPPHLRRAPLTGMPRGRDAEPPELVDDRARAAPLVDEPRVDHPDYTGLRLIDDEPPGRRRIGAISVGVARHDEAAPGLLALAPDGALDDLGALVLGYNALDVEEELPLGR